MRRDDLDALLAEQGIMRAAVHAGIGIEAGLATWADAQEFARSPFVHQVVRALLEVSGGAEDARAIAELIPAGVPQLWHGYDERTWEVLAAAADAGVDTRVGLEAVLVLPDGRAAIDNAELTAAAVVLSTSRRSAMPIPARSSAWHGTVNRIIGDEQVDDPTALPGEGAHPLDVHPRAADRLSQPRQLARFVLQYHGEVGRHLVPLAPRSPATILLRAGVAAARIEKRPGSAQPGPGTPSRRSR